MQNATEKRRVAIYIRVSTPEQDDDGYGLEAQRKRLLEYVEQNTALNLDTKSPEWVFEDIHTGSDTNRTALIDLMKRVKNKEFDAVLVFKIDRLSRNLRHLLEIFDVMKENEVSFISMQENLDFRGPIGSLIFQIFGSIAQFERELIKGRMLEGVKASAEMGNYTGTSIPYGYTPIKNPHGKGRILKIIPEEKERVKELYNWYIYDGLGDDQIAKKLNKLNVPRGEHTKSKKKYGSWEDTSIKRILTNTIYHGEYAAVTKDENGAKLPLDKQTIVKIPACISFLTFEQAKHIRRERKGGYATRDYLLSGKLKDMSLAKPKTFVGAKRSKGGFSYRRKQFNENGVHFPVFEIPGKQMEDSVWEKIQEALNNPEQFIQNYLARECLDKKKVDKLQEHLDALQNKRVQIEMSIGRVQVAFEKGIYDDETVAEKLRDYDKELSETDTEIIKDEKELSFLSSIDLEIEQLKTASEQVGYRLDNLSVKNKKILCQLFVDKVEVYREYIDDKPKIHSEVLLRFNPKELSKVQDRGRTQASQQQEQNRVQKLQKDDNGRQLGNGYHPFRFYFVFDKESITYTKNGTSRGSERVVLHECNRF